MWERDPEGIGGQRILRISNSDAYQIHRQQHLEIQRSISDEDGTQVYSFDNDRILINLSISGLSLACVAQWL